MWTLTIDNINKEIGGSDADRVTIWSEWGTNETTMSRNSNAEIGDLHVRWLAWEILGDVIERWGTCYVDMTGRYKSIKSDAVCRSVVLVESYGRGLQSWSSSSADRTYQQCEGDAATLLSNRTEADVWKMCSFSRTISVQGTHVFKVGKCVGPPNPRMKNWLGVEFKQTNLVLCLPLTRIKWEVNEHFYSGALRNASHVVLNDFLL